MEVKEGLPHLLTQNGKYYDMFVQQESLNSTLGCEFLFKEMQRVPGDSHGHHGLLLPGYKRMTLSIRHDLFGDLRLAFLFCPC